MSYVWPSAFCRFFELSGDQSGTIMSPCLMLLRMAMLYMNASGTQAALMKSVLGRSAGGSVWRALWRLVSRLCLLPVYHSNLLKPLVLGDRCALPPDSQARTLVFATKVLACTASLAWTRETFSTTYSMNCLWITAGAMTYTLLVGGSMSRLMALLLLIPSFQSFPLILLVAMSGSLFTPKDSNMLRPFMSKRPAESTSVFDARCAYLGRTVSVTLRSVTTCLTLLHSRKAGAWISLCSGFAAGGQPCCLLRGHAAACDGWRQN